MLHHCLCPCKRAQRRHVCSLCRRGGYVFPRLLHNPIAYSNLELREVVRHWQCWGSLRYEGRASGDPQWKFVALYTANPGRLTCSHGVPFLVLQIVERPRIMHIGLIHHTWYLILLLESIVQGTTQTAVPSPKSHAWQTIGRQSRQLFVVAIGCISVHYSGRIGASGRRRDPHHY